MCLCVDWKDSGDPFSKDSLQRRCDATVGMVLGVVVADVFAGDFHATRLAEIFIAHI